MQWKYVTLILIVISLACYCSRPTPDIFPDKIDTLVAPRLIKRSLPVYPAEARQKGWEGTVGLFLLVNDSGRVQQIRMASPSKNDLLDSAAVRYAKTLEFRPALDDGKPIDVWVDWTVAYKLENKAPDFSPVEYAIKIVRLKKQATSMRDKISPELLIQIFQLQQQYAQFIHENPDLNLFGQVKHTVSSEILASWQPYWQIWSLSFPVFHDFLVIFPDNRLTPAVTDTLMENLQRDLMRILGQSVGQSEIERDFVLNVKQFLETNYRQSYPAALRRLIGTYLEVSIKKLN